MKTWHIAACVGDRIEEFGSQGASISPLVSNVESAHAVILQLESEGRLGTHPAASDQLLITLNGSGVVKTTAGESTQVQAGSCVLWKEGEHHSTQAGRDGLTALVLEGANLSALVNRGPYG